jgi:hypothetical protein
MMVIIALCFLSAYLTGMNNFDAVRAAIASKGIVNEDLGDPPATNLPIRPGFDQGVALASSRFDVNTPIEFEDSQGAMTEHRAGHQRMIDMQVELIHLS